MFEGSLLESTALLQNRNRWPAMLSFAAQAVVVATLVAVPMLHPELLPMHAPTISLAPPPVPHVPPPPPQPLHVHADLAASTAPTAPSAPPAARSTIHVLLPAAPSATDTPIAATVGNMTGAGPGTSLSSIAGIGNSPNVTVASAAPPATHANRVALSGGVTTGMLLAPIRPEYPAIAKAAHVEGSVIVRAVISRSGQIESAQVISGSPLLSNAALEAVQHARYKPYLLSGQPTEVDTTITINFRLGS